MKKIWIFLCCIMLSVFFPQTVYAVEVTPEEASIDIVFVIDCSGSMKANDPSKTGLDMVQAFIDTAQSESVQVGYVAYNDTIVSYSVLEPIEAVQKRDALKSEIASIQYSGDTDIGQGISYAYEILSAGKGSRHIMVLISDGETDLPAASERTKEQSDYELGQCVSQCSKEDIQIYTIAFGKYDGNKAVLEEIAAETDAGSYSVQSPMDLIEVLYGIFQDSLFYQIQQFSNGVYAGGNQEIKCVLNASYLDEIDILLLSSAPIGKSAVKYGETEIALTDLSRYAVGKITHSQIEEGIKELNVLTETAEKQDLQVYVICYRKLVPILQIDTNARRNQELEYQVYFKSRDGNVIHDAGFYGAFSWELACGNTNVDQEKISVSDEGLKGKISFSHSGTYMLRGTLADEFGSFTFPAHIEVTNSMPTGNMPEDHCTLLDEGWEICLDDYFADQDNDTLLYSVTDVQEGIDVRLEGNLLTVIPQRVGTHTIAIQISDGENAVQYVHRVEVVPLWKVYWWVIVLALAVLAVIFWRLTHKPKPELERLTEEKKKNHFCGKLDAYFVLQPEDEEEIPPLSFQMHKVKDGRVSLGDLFGAYPKQAEALHLEDIFLIADENRAMILYHRSPSGVMIGNAIACMQIQYNISFGDIVYITSPQGDYDLEIHYVAVLQ